MKTNTQIKALLKLGILALFIAAAITFTSCKKSEEPKDSEKVAEEHNEAKFDANDKKEDDSEFMVTAASINLEEIELGKLAQAQGVSKEVRDYGKMLVADHAKSFKELNDLAQQKQITIPQTITDEGKDSYKDLTGNKITDFDQKFMDKMVNGHKDAIAKFEDAQENAKDPNIKTWVSGTLPGLRTHLDHALNLQQKLEKN